MMWLIYEYSTLSNTQKLMCWSNSATIRDMQFFIFATWFLFLLIFSIIFKYSSVCVGFLPCSYLVSINVFLRVDLELFKKILQTCKTQGKPLKTWLQWELFLFKNKLCCCLKCFLIWIKSLKPHIQKKKKKWIKPVKSWKLLVVCDFFHM